MIGINSRLASVDDVAGNTIPKTAIFPVKIRASRMNVYFSKHLKISRAQRDSDPYGFESRVHLIRNFYYDLSVLLCLFF